MRNLFNSVKLTKPKKNVFDLSHDVKMSLKMGWLYPTCVLECVPGDKFSIGSESLLRFAPLVAPVMHRMDLYQHYFFVPNRLLWPGWEDFIINGGASGTPPAFPTLPINTITGAVGSLADYLGCPVPTSGGHSGVNALPFSAYQCIVNEYYRDQNLVPEISYQLINGNNSANSPALMNMRKRAWEHDYFTSALPFAQKGDAVNIPIGTLDDVNVLTTVNPTAGTTLTGTPDNVTVPYGAGGVGIDSQLYAETSALDIGSTTINDLRRAFRLQEWMERNALGGTRYKENIQAHFGVNSPDQRLDRPEYITGSKSPVVISEVLNTTGTEDAPQGTMAGHAVSVAAGKYGKYFCQEHGYIIGIMSVMPKTAYQQGFPKHFLKTEDPFQYYWPTFAHIGEQEVKVEEVYAYTANADETFGYVPRYAEYKFAQNRVAGDFRTTLDFWHLGRIFSSEPALNQSFIEATPDTRIFAVETGDYLYAHVLHKIRAIRAMPKFGTPHF